jgi:trimethylamine:corrinoid methyltransferase-like protein
MFGETVLCSNMMNSLHHLSKKMQYDYYYYSVKKKNRFSKWSKPEENDIVNVISEQYKVNKSRAKEYLSLLTEDDIQTLKQMNYKGGTKN